MILVMIKLQRAPWWRIREEEKKKKSNMNISFCGKKGVYSRRHMLPLQVSSFNEHLNINKG